MTPKVSRWSLTYMSCIFQANVWSFAIIYSKILSRKKPFFKVNKLKDIIEKEIKDERLDLFINCEEFATLVQEYCTLNLL